MPAALERGGGAVALSIAKAVILALQESRTSTEGIADAFSNPITKALADPEIFADSQILPNPEVLPDSEIVPNPEVLADPQTHSGAET